MTSYSYTQRWLFVTSLSMLALANIRPIRAENLRRDLWFLNTTRTVTPSVIGQGCSQRQPCEEGLSCLRAPSVLGLLVPRKVCIPFECLAKAVKDLDDQVNVTAYQESIFSRSGVTYDEFFMRDQKDRSWQPLSGLATVRAMQESPKVHAVMQTIRENPINPKIWRGYETALGACDPTNLLSKDATTPGVVGTFGFGASGGAGLGGAIEFFWSFPDSEGGPLPFHINLGGGLIFGADVGPGVSIGMVFTGTPEDIPGTGFELSLSAPLPVVGPGIAVGVDVTNVWSLDFIVGLGPGFAVGSFIAGYTWGIE